MSIIDIVSAPPGGLVYQLITLFAIEAVFGMAVDGWLRSRQAESRRLAIAFGLILLMRIVQMIAGLITWQGWLPPQDILPPLERFVDLASLVLIFYGFAPTQGRWVKFNFWFCIGNLGLALVVYVLFAPIWYLSVFQDPTLSYNGSWQEMIWEIWQILVLIWALFIFARHAVQQRGLLISAFAILLLGHLLHITLMQGSPHVAGWERLANLIAFSILAAAVYRITVGGLVGRLEQAEATGRQNPATRTEPAVVVGLPKQAAREDAAVVEQLRFQLSVTQTSLEKARQAAQERANWPSPEVVDKLRAELAQVSTELAQARQEVGEKAHWLSPERAEEIRAELQKAQAELAETHYAGQPQPIWHDSDLVEQLQIELVKAQEELAEAHRGVERRSAQTSEGDFEEVRAELVRAYEELAALRRELDLSSAPPNAEAIRQLQIALLQAQEEVMQTRREIRELQERAAQPGLAAEDCFSATLHQDLRIPINLVGGYTDLLLSGSLGQFDDAQSKFLQRIKSNIERMRNVLNNLVCLSTLDSGRMNLKMVEADIRQIVDNVVLQSKAQLEEKQIDLTIDIPADLPRARVDVMRMEQVIGNLLSNACRSSPLAGHVKISARLQGAGADSSGPVLALSVRDSGGGIATKDQNKVFERPGQAAQRPISGLGERGIGLTVAKSLTQAHQGRLWFESESGLGTTFIVTLPLNGNDLGNEKEPKAKGAQGDLVGLIGEDGLGNHRSRWLS